MQGTQIKCTYTNMSFSGFYSELRGERALGTFLTCVLFHVMVESGELNRGNTRYECVG